MSLGDVLCLVAAIILILASISSIMKDRDRRQR